MRRIGTAAILLAFAGSACCQVGLGTVSPNSDLDVRGSLAAGYRSFGASTTATATDYFLVFTGFAAVNLTLPDATTCTGRIYWIKNASPTLPVPVVTVNTTSSQTIDGNANWLLDEPNEALRLVSDGSDWQVCNLDVPVRKTAVFGGGWNQGGNRLSAAKSVGTIGNFDLPFVTNNSEGMRLASNGFLGIGTTNPSARLHVVSDNDDAGNDYYFSDHGTTLTPGVFFRKARGTLAAPQNLQAGDLIAQFRFAPRYNGSVINNNGSGIDAYYQGNGTNNSTDLQWYTSHNQNLTLNQSGYAGIGTSAFDATNPEKLLIDAGNTASYNVISGKGDIDNYLQLNIQNRSTGGFASSDLVATADNGTELVNYIDMGINGSGYNNAPSGLLNGTDLAYLYTTGNDFVLGNSSAGTNLVFFTGGYALANERMRMTAAGNMGIGTNSPSDKLTVAGIVSPATDNAYTLGTSTNRWSETWSANGVIQTSDLRLKTNIQTLPYGLRELQRLNPVAYNWKKTSDANGKCGLIAQQVQQTIPEVVTGDERTGVLGMNYAELIPLLINAIKEQQLRLDKLKRELELMKK